MEMGWNRDDRDEPGDRRDRLHPAHAHGADRGARHRDGLSHERDLRMEADDGWPRVLPWRDLMRRLLPLLGACALTACGLDRGTESARRYDLGRAATPQEIAALDIDVGPDGEGLPPGSGTVAQGEVLFAQKCAVCHGAKGEGVPPAYPAIVGRDPKAEGFQFGKDPKLNRTIGNYWPYATTIFDYIRRAMP